MVRVELACCGKWGLKGQIRPVHLPVRLYLVDVSVYKDHLPVKAVKGTDAEVSLPQQFTAGDVPVVDSGQKGIDGRGLESGVFLRARAAENEKQQKGGKEEPFFQHDSTGPVYN